MISPSGEQIECLEIAHGGLRATILNLGASLFALEVFGSRGSRPVILSNRQPRDYWANPHYLGAIVGRCANRIRGGRCEIDGRPHQLDRNERGITHLHGGSDGFSRRLWTVKRHSQTAVDLELRSADGDQGYPGNLVASCSYALLPDCRLRLSMTAVTDRTTLVNLAGHAYFNLEQGRSILDHTLQIEAAHYTPVDDDLIPDGRIEAVDGTCFDFRRPVTIGQRRHLSSIGYDHNFAVSGTARESPSRVATLVAPSGDLAMELSTTEPGLQFYDGQKLTGSGSDGSLAFGPLSGCCLEPQRFPDAIHHPHFAQSLLRPGERYRQVTEYRFLL
jgi:aldose 1-epimerase